MLAGSPVANVLWKEMVEADTVEAAKAGQAAKGAKAYSHSSTPPTYRHYLACG